MGLHVFYKLGRGRDVNLAGFEDHVGATVEIQRTQEDCLNFSRLFVGAQGKF